MKYIYFKKWSDLTAKEMIPRVAVTCLELHSHQGQRHWTVSSAGDLKRMNSNPLGSQLGGILPCHKDILQVLETLLVVQL